MPFKVKYRSMLKKQTKLSTMSLQFWLDFLSSYDWKVYFLQDPTRYKKIPLYSYYLSRGFYPHKFVWPISCNATSFGFLPNQITHNCMAFIAWAMGLYNVNTLESKFNLRNGATCATAGIWTHGRSCVAVDAVQILAAKKQCLQLTY